MNETILKFDYPRTLLGEYDHWVVLLRPKQITAGSLVLACKEQATRLPEVSEKAFTELPRVTRELEAALKASFDFQKINYVLLMMVDKYVHFHVIPRYASEVKVNGVTFIDPGWPKHPDMTHVVDVTNDQFDGLLQLIKSKWPKA